MNKKENKKDAENVEKRFVSMLSDYGFKVTFANEADTTFLKKAIQALIKSEVPIKEIEFKRNELTAVTMSSRGGLYDVTCIDEKGRRFIIEMQVTDLKHFIHRAKFYGFYHFNVIVKRGKYRFDDLKKIYVVSILAGTAYPEIEEYHQDVCLRNQNGDLIDDQITHIIVELGKWNKSVEEIEKDNLDIDKLLYLMKMTNELTLDENKANNFEYPSFFLEDWIQKAINELDLSQMPPEKRAMVEMQLVQDAQLAYHYEEDKIKYAKEYAKKIEEEKVKAEQELALAERKGHQLLVSSFLKINYSKEQIAELQSWETEYVEELIKDMKDGI